MSSDQLVIFVLVKLPQSQNVHGYGQPLLVSQAAMYFIPSVFSTNFQTIFVKYGEGSEFNSVILGCGGFLNFFVSIPLISEKSLSFE